MILQNCYYDQVKIILPRVLGFFDSDQSSSSFGLGDRYYWAWKLIDFGNATYQSSAHGMSRLWVSGFWPYNTSQKEFLNRINSIFQGTEKLTYTDGSLEEAFPREGSFCVTALVAYDLLCTLELLKNITPLDMSNRWKEIISKFINFLCSAKETHGMISNHLATASAALIRWGKLYNDRVVFQKGKALLNIILNNQSSEGWYPEYEGFDPGYQSLCLNYLADIYVQEPSLKLKKSLEKAINHLSYFAHPDGSFGGIYGSRGTRFYFPSGIILLSKYIKKAKDLALFMEKSINNKSVVTLQSLDDTNLIPMFNSYVWAAQIKSKKTNNLKKKINLPVTSQVDFFKKFFKSGILIIKKDNFYTIINYFKGGVIYHYLNGVEKYIDVGLILKNKLNSKLISTQNFNKNNKISIKNKKIIIKSKFSYMPRKLSTPLQFTILRIMSMSIFFSRNLRELFKQFLVKYLITRNKFVDISNQRYIELGEEIKVDDIYDINDKFIIVNNKTKFLSIHMASQGYWQIQDEDK